MLPLYNSFVVGFLRSTATRIGILAVVCAAGFRAAHATEQFFDALGHPAIGYLTRPVDDAVARLERRLDAGGAQLTFEPGTGYLRSLLRELDLPISSQMAVYSKTSFQSSRIGPDNPRAIYFGDSVAVAWPRGGAIEIAAQDARQGMHFYLLEQKPAAAPRFAQPTQCLSCHHSSPTEGVPGLLTRSIITAPDGTTRPWLGNNTSDHRSPLAERWGGWYVTGQVNGANHLGNAFVRAKITDPETASRTGFDTPASLEGKFETAAYLSPYSDVVALLVFQHQTRMMNLLTLTGWQVRLAQSEQPGTVAALANAAARDVVDYLLFVDEAPLPGRISGTSGFTAEFTARGPRDRQGRSLRQLDLERRLLRYPCSYLIYSEAFDALPPAALDAIYRRLWQVLSGKEPDAEYRRLTRDDRQAIVDILRDTKPTLPEYFVDLDR